MPAICTWANLADLQGAIILHGGKSFGCTEECLDRPNALRIVAFCWARPDQHGRTLDSNR